MGLGFYPATHEFIFAQATMSNFLKSSTETNQILIHDEPMIQDLDLGPGFRTWIWELDLGLGFGTGLGLDNLILALISNIPL